MTTVEQRNKALTLAWQAGVSMAELVEATGISPYEIERVLREGTEAKG